MRIMIIAAAANVRTTAAAVARRCGWESEETDALPARVDPVPDLLLYDIALGGGDGLAGLRRVAPGAEILLLSTEADQAEVLVCLKSGAAGYLLTDDPAWAEDLAKRLKGVG